MPKILTPEQREESKQKRREYMRSWEQAHREERRARRALWRKEHPQREAEAKLRYYAKLLESIKQESYDEEN